MHNNLLSFFVQSQAEMESVLQLGVDPSRIIYSHTRKRPSTLAYAMDKNIDLMTFDDEFELLKTKGNGGIEKSHPCKLG